MKRKKWNNKKKFFFQKLYYINLQILIYFNFCYFFVCFALEMSSIVFKIYVFKHESIRWIKFALEF